MINIYLFSFIFSFFVSIILLSIFILVQRQNNIGQIVRLEGPEMHYKKNKTPTMGGIVFCIVTVISFFMGMILYEDEFSYKIIILIILPFIFYSLLGFIDDYLIFKYKSNIGIPPLLKFIFQLLIPLFFYFILDDNTIINIFKFEINLKYLYPLFILFLFTSSTNAVNLTDGLDGLAGGTIITSLISLIIVSYYKNEYILLIFLSALLGSLIAFMFLNFNPAKIMMGDSGSLALGSVLVISCVILKIELFIILIGFIFIVETLSVIIQVLYFKYTGGKRIFLMSPLHHHFEYKGYSEKKICLMFYSINLISNIIFLIVYL